MKIVEIIPGAIATPNPVTLPAAAPDIFAILSAQIIRATSGLTDHAVHDHPINVAGGGGAGGTMTFAAAVFQESGAGATVNGGGAAGQGVRNNTAAQAHTAANPIVAATPTMITARTFSLNVNVLVGDIVELAYLEVGERVRV